MAGSRSRTGDGGARRGQGVGVSATSSGEAAAARAGADIEVPAAEPSPELPEQDFDAAALDAARVALPSWDVHHDGLTRTVSSAHPGELQTALRDVGGRLGRVPLLSAHDRRVVIRLPAASGSLTQLIELARALEDELAGEVD